MRTGYSRSVHFGYKPMLAGVKGSVGLSGPKVLKDSGTKRVTAGVAFCNSA